MGEQEGQTERTSDTHTHTLVQKVQRVADKMWKERT